MDQQTLEIVESLRNKVNHISNQMDQAPLIEFYDPRREKAKLRRTALASAPAAKTAAKPAAAPAAKPATPAAKPAMSPSEKTALANVQAKNKEAEAAKAAKAQPSQSPAKQALLARIKKLINQSVEEIDVNALVEDIEIYLEMTNPSEASHVEMKEFLSVFAQSLLEQYELEEGLKTKLESILAA